MSFPGRQLVFSELRQFTSARNCRMGCLASCGLGCVVGSACLAWADSADDSFDFETVGAYREVFAKESIPMTAGCSYFDAALASAG